jgi:tripartite-type tricarboxylate transporter receptor subunit TctC
MSSISRRRFNLAIGAAVLGGTSPAIAQSSKVGRLIIGFGAGNPFDSLARLLVEKLRVSLGMSMIVENKPGASGAIAAEMIKQGPTDGSLIWLSPFATLITEPIVNKAAVRFDPLRDFTPVAQVATFDIALAVGSSVPARTLAEYIAMVKADPAKGNFGTPGSRNLPHFFTLLVGKAAGVQFTNVAFKSAGDAMTAALGGHIPAVTSGLGDLIEVHRAGKMRILATSGAKRSSFLPDVPTFREEGYAVEGRGWFGILLPPSTSHDVVMQVNGAVVDALNSKELIDFMRSGGLDRPVSTSPEAFVEIMKGDIAKWGETIRDSGVKLEN